MRFGMMASISLAAFLSHAAPVHSANMDEVLRNFSEQFGTPSIEALDLDQSGFSEVLMMQTESCPEEGCAWILVRQGPGAPEMISEGSAFAARLEPTTPAGGVLFTDGITWALGETGLFPFGDVLGLTSPRPTSVVDLENINAIPQFMEARASDISSWSFPYVVDGETVFAHVHIMTGRDYLIGHWGSPYVIFDNQGNLMHEGISTEFPRIFNDPATEGFSVIDIVPAGLIIQRFE